MNIFFSDSEAKKFRIFLENIKNHFEKNTNDADDQSYAQYNNFTYGDTILKNEIKTFLTISNLENNWILFNKLLVEKSFFKKPTFNKIKNKIFLVDTEDNFLNFKNKICPSGNLKTILSSSEKDVEPLILKIENKVTSTLSDEFKVELRTYFSNFSKKNRDTQVSLIIKLMKYINKDTQKNIPRTTAASLLKINTERMKKVLNPLIEEALK